MLISHFSISYESFVIGDISADMQQQVINTLFNTGLVTEDLSAMNSSKAATGTGRKIPANLNHEHHNDADRNLRSQPDFFPDIDIWRKKAARPSIPKFQTVFPTCSESSNTADLVQDKDFCTAWWTACSRKEVAWAEDSQWHKERWYPGIQKMDRWKERRVGEERNRNSHLGNAKFWEGDYSELLQLREAQKKRIESMETRDKLFPENARKNQAFADALSCLPDDDNVSLDSYRTSDPGTNDSWDCLSKKKLGSIEKWSSTLRKKGAENLGVGDM